MGVCCVLSLCCPPENDGGAKARKLEEHLFSTTDPVRVEAFEQLYRQFRLVPRDVDAELHKALDQALEKYLKDRGLPLTEPDEK